MENGKLSAEKLTKIYLKIKAKRAELSAKFKEEDQELKEDSIQMKHQ